jgi:TRAP transporter TAXI family solute receptor
MTPIHRLTRAILLLLGLALVGCDQAPDEAAVRAVLGERLEVALKPPVTEVAAFRRIGSGPLPAAADGKARRIVYYNAILELKQDVNFSSWNGLNASAFATLLGATERGIIGIRQDGNKSGDELRVHGSATFIDENGTWQAVPWVPPQVGVASPADNTGPPSEAKRLLDGIQALLTGGGGPRDLRTAIVTEELGKAFGWMQLRVDRLDKAFVVAGGQTGGEYAGVAELIAARLADGGLKTQVVATAGSFENVGLIHQLLADVGIVQSDVAAAAAQGTGRFATDGAIADLRALGSLFPEAIQIVVARDSPIATIADLKGKRVDIGQPGSGTRLNAEAVLAASGVAVSDLGEAKQAGLSEGLRQLAAGEVDAVITTIAAPARSLQQAATGPGGIRLLSIGTQERAILAGAQPDLVPVTLPPNTYPGQTETVETAAVTAILVGTAALSDATVEALLGEVYGGIDFVRAGSTAGSLISKATAQTGLTLPLHPAAERFLLRATATQ